MHTYFETHRLRLRNMQVEDAAHFFELNSDPDVMRYTGDKSFESIKKTEEFLAHYQKTVYEKEGYGRWTVELKEDGSFLGWCGLRFQENYQKTDIGYRLLKKHWNKGYATEAAQFSLHYGFDSLKLPLIIGRVAKENAASIRVFEKLGLIRVGDELCGHDPAWLYEITAEQYFNQL